MERRGFLASISAVPAALSFWRQKEKIPEKLPEVKTIFDAEQARERRYACLPAEEELHAGDFVGLGDHFRAIRGDSDCLSPVGSSRFLGMATNDARPGDLVSVLIPIYLPDSLSTPDVRFILSR